MMAGGLPISVPTSAANAFRVTAQDIEARITKKTKAIILSYPNNPTGAILERADLESIAAVLRRQNIVVISDEVYAELTYGETGHTSIAALPEMQERTIVLNGFSKAFAMTGWRLGYAVAPPEIMDVMFKIHQYAIMCAPTTSQYAAIEALKSCDGEIEKMADEYNRRRRFIVNRLNEMGLKCFDPGGAFYAFPSIQSTGMKSMEFCEKLLAAKRVAVVPGDAFGESGEGFVRICYAQSMQNIVEAMKRVEEFIREI